MRRTGIVLALTTSLLTSVCSAQQTATTSQQHATTVGNQANKNEPGGGPPSVVNCTNAQNGRIAIFTQVLPPNVVLCNSGIYEAQPYGTGAVGILNPSPVAPLDVNGSINTNAAYQIGWSSVLTDNIGNSNLAVGSSAGTVSGGSGNTFVGASAGSASNTGSSNTFYGFGAGHSNLDGSSNTFSGSEAGENNGIGSFNTFYGVAAGVNNTTGSSNTAIGNNAYTGNSSGSENIALGNFAGVSNQTGSYNIYIGNSGSTTESGTIRMGTTGRQSATYIAGIYGVNVGGVPVYINSNGQLGVQTSSARFKDQVADMGGSTDSLMKLRPVIFFYKPEYDKGERILQYGLIAEEVATVYPELVAYDNDGQPYTVRYQYLSTMLLNEVQKQYHRAEAEAKVIETQAQKIEALEQRLSRLEKLVTQVQTVAQK